jgi:hypothetical protein
LLALTASHYLSAASGPLEASFWKRGSFRSGSNIGSSRVKVDRKIPVKQDFRVIVAGRLQPQ